MPKNISTTQQKFTRLTAIAIFGTFILLATSVASKFIFQHLPTHLLQHTSSSDAIQIKGQVAVLSKEGVPKGVQEASVCFSLPHKSSDSYSFDVYETYTDKDGTFSLTLYLSQEISGPVRITVRQKDYATQKWAYSVIDLQKDAKHLLLELNSNVHRELSRIYLTNEIFMLKGEIANKVDQLNVIKDSIDQHSHISARIIQEDLSSIIKQLKLEHRFLTDDSTLFISDDISKRVLENAISESYKFQDSLYRTGLELINIPLQ